MVSTAQPLDLINLPDVDQLARRFRNAEPFPHICIDDFLVADFAERVTASYPAYSDAQALGRTFSAVNENRKVQVTDPDCFPEPVEQLNRLLASPPFLDLMSRITGIPNLLADDELDGGGMHVMGSGGRLDVHVDFNLIEDRQLFRRLNILVFMNERWEEEWGGAIELWDSEVEHCGTSLLPMCNRCVLFATSEISYHGVTKLRCPKDTTRNSFAAYYYTREAPPDFVGHKHTTRFEARPGERWREAILLPAERAARGIRPSLSRLKRALLSRG